MNFLCPACRTPLPVTPALSVVPCTGCGVEVDLTRMDTAPGSAKLWPEVDLSNEKLGDYQLERRIGAGGMGAVYEAKGPAGVCAVKVLSALLAAEPGLRTRFRREAAALRAISHEGVVRVLAEGEERGFCWYAMERVTGPDLRARIAQARLLPAEVTDLARRLLAALGVVHAAGFVHRDVKPGNILMAPGGPKLCDFGIARFDGSTTLTESAAMLGSLRYMAPEQRFGRADARSDLYAVGVVLHECFAGGVPGEADLPPGVPARLRRLIDALLSTKPDQRPPTAAAALALLEKKSRVAVTAGALTALVAAVAAAAVGPGLLDQGRQARTQESAEIGRAFNPKMAAAIEAAQNANEPAVRAGEGQGNRAPAPQVLQAPIENALANALGSEPVPNTFGGLGTKETKGLGLRGTGSEAKPLKPTPPPVKQANTKAPREGLDAFSTTGAVESLRKAVASRRARRGFAADAVLAKKAEVLTEPVIPPAEGKGGQDPTGEPRKIEQQSAVQQAAPQPAATGLGTKGGSTKKKRAASDLKK